MTEVRLIPTRSDIAFVEYSDAASSAVAREALHNIKLDGETKMKVSVTCLVISRAQADASLRLR